MNRKCNFIRIRESLMILITALFSCTNESAVLTTEKTIEHQSRNLESSHQYYWANGEKRTLTIDSSLLFIVADISSFSSNNNVKSLLSIINNGILTPLYYDEEELRNLLSQKSGTLNGIFHGDDIVNYNGIKYKNRFYTDANGNSIGMTNEILIKLKDINDMPILQEYIAKYELLLIDNPNSLWYVLQCPSDKSGTSLDIANKMYESGYFEESYPNLLTQLEKCTVDTYYSEQWGLENPEYPEIDIDYPNAMTYPLPYINAITVAVIDDGITTTHPELNLSTYGYNAHLKQEAISVSPGTHGTMVAGIIGAKSNNYIGIAGVCPNVKLMSISYRFKEDYPNDYTSSIQIANGVKKAYENGASVINCSYGAISVDPYVFNEYNNAMTMGRGGRGCIIVFGAGNDDDEITNTYAINLPDVIVVGAINKSGLKYRFSSYGEHLDIVAPGSGIWSTTVNGEYSYAGGTSMATPYVSGVAALILARNPTLTREQVVDIIYSSAKKIPNYSFTSTPTRDYTWNQYVGYGLVDANAALSITPAP